MSTRPPCPGCGQDEGPRHVEGRFNAPPGTVPPVPWHITCHAAAGCAHCKTLTEENING